MNILRRRRRRPALTLRAAQTIAASLYTDTIAGIPTAEDTIRRLGMSHDDCARMLTYLDMHPEAFDPSVWSAARAYLWAEVW